MNKKMVLRIGNKNAELKILEKVFSLRKREQGLLQSEKDFSGFEPEDLSLFVL